MLKNALHSLQILISPFLSSSDSQPFMSESSVESFQNTHTQWSGAGKGADILRNSTCGSDIQLSVRASTLEDRNMGKWVYLLIYKYFLSSYYISGHPRPEDTASNKSDKTSLSSWPYILRNGRQSLLSLLSYHTKGREMPHPLHGPAFPCPQGS